MSEHFDLKALREALDERRQALGLSWAEVGAELGVSASTLSGLGARRTAEGDGVLRAVAWLGRSPESFVPGHPPGSQGTPLRRPPSTLRFDARALFVALEAARVARGMTWQEVALSSGVSNAATLTRLRAGGRVMFPGVMGVLTWLGAPAARFVRAVNR